MSRPPATTADAVLTYIRDFINDNRVPPTYQEIADEFGICESSGRNYVLRLAQDGRITHRPKAASKALRITLR